MTDEEKRLARRFEELSARSYNKGIWVYSDFLTTAQQAMLQSMKLGAVAFFGGYDGAERRVACFGSEDACGYDACPECVWLAIEPVAKKFADELTHRDFFGSIMALGLKREVLGDIIVYDNCAYLYCMESVSGYVAENLTQVKHTTVACRVVEAPPVESVALPEEEEFVIASERLDAAIASVYNMSRSVCKDIVEQGKVSVNSILVANPSRTLEEHDTVSVRGKGRFIFEGICRETRKGKLRALIRVYR